MDIVPAVMMNQQFLPHIGISQFLKGAQYDPLVVREALKEESGKYFVPNVWLAFGN